VLDELAAEGIEITQTPVVVGGMIPEDDEAKLLELGVAKVYTPKDLDITAMVGDIADLIGT
jgi:(2R)-ethylmalonyl-CoA mutase